METIKNTHSLKRNNTKTWLRVIGQAGGAFLGWRWGGKRRKGMDLQGEGTHQSLISRALESSPTFFLQVLRPHWDPRAFHSWSLHCCEERKPVFSFMVHVYFWCVAGIVMFLMAGPGGLSRMMVHLRETVLMMHWPWLQAPSVLNKHTHSHNVTHSLKIPSLCPIKVITCDTDGTKFSWDLAARWKGWKKYWFYR